MGVLCCRVEITYSRGELGWDLIFDFICSEATMVADKIPPYHLKVEVRSLSTHIAKMEMCDAFLPSEMRLC